MPRKTIALDLTLRLDDLLKIDDLKEFKKAVLRELLPHWRTLHPQRTRKQTGPPRLPALDVYESTASVLETLSRHEWQSLGWKELIARVQTIVKEHQTGIKRRGALYSEATIRKHVRDYIYTILYWNEIPPRLLDRRQPWMPSAAKTRRARVEAFLRYKANLPYPEGARDGALDCYVGKRKKHKP